MRWADPLLEFYHMMDKYEAFKAAFAEWGAWIIVIKGLTPIPFKLVTIASGAAQFNLAGLYLGLARLAAVCGFSCSPPCCGDSASRSATLSSAG